MSLLLAIPMAPALQAGGSGPDMQRFALMSGVLILLIIGLGLLMRLVMTRSWKARSAKRSLEVIDALPVGSRQKLIVVRCYDRNFLVAVGDKELHCMTELTDSLDPVELGGEPQAPARQEMRQQPATAAQSPEFMEQLRRELRPAAGEAAAPADRARTRRRRRLGEGIIG